ncbi:hypothetical protein [Streptomyces spectabilis]|uniref:Adenylate kinase n=1 Tax=Streptomyces spectabilis TaxID=68270 RepID=A0A516RF88_STRST|nr:hypothetical protein [Streptomyces spectabilis]QDQ14314.1 hypothetical protein FH965_30175 [Streptomyces spectabilis]
MRDIALIGRARSGKDSVGARLIARYGYTRLAFADPLKDMAIGINPWISYDVPGFIKHGTIRLADLIEHVGWERAKEEYSEVRSTLQRIGQHMRSIDPDYWIDRLTKRLARTSGPIVVTDVRYPNEVDKLDRYGFRIVRIARPSIESTDAHESETALDKYVAPVTVTNSGTLDDLHAHADTLPH